MEKMVLGTSEGTKSLYGLPTEDLNEAPSEGSMEDTRNKQWSQFYDKELDALQWAKEFMDAYERKHKNTRIRK